MYGSDAIILTELGEASWSRQNFDEPRNDESLRENLDLIHEI